VIFSTASGSKYEVDAPGKRVRQIAGGASERINRNGAGQWVDFSDCLIKMNKPALFFWGDQVKLLDGSPMGASPITYTSPVVEVDHVKDVQDAALRK
jgi:hypothetical protein